MLSALKAPLAAAILAVFAVPAEAAHICWIESVQTAGDGVQVRLTEPRMVDLKGSRSAVSTVLPVRLGDQFFIHNLPEVSCAMEVVHHGAQTGLEVRLAQHFPLPGRLGGQQFEFIPAD